MDLTFCDIPSAHGSNHTVVVTDYASRMVFVSNQTIKSQTSSFVIKLIHFLENQTGVTVKLIQKDKGREFLGDLKIFIEKKGIELWNTCTGESLQNGIVERTHQTL